MNIRSKLAQGLSAVALAANMACGSGSAMVPADPICDATFQMAQSFSLPWDGSALNLGVGPFMISQSSLLDPYTNELVDGLPSGCEYVDDRRGGQYGFHEPLPLEVVCCENTVYAEAHVGYFTEVATRHAGMRTDNGLEVGGSISDFTQLYPDAERAWTHGLAVYRFEQVKTLNPGNGTTDAFAVSSSHFDAERHGGAPAVPGPQNSETFSWY